MGPLPDYGLAKERLLSDQRINLEKTFSLSIISFCFDTKSAIATFDIAIAIFIYFTALRSRS
jgi:hypothetical protein